MLLSRNWQGFHHMLEQMTIWFRFRLSFWSKCFIGTVLFWRKLRLMTSHKYGFRWSSLHNFEIHGIENTVSDSSSIVLGILAAICLLCRCLAMDISVALLWVSYFGFEVSLQYQWSIRICVTDINCIINAKIYLTNTISSARCNINPSVLQAFKFLLTSWDRGHLNMQMR
jgi:hypothetical protein